MQCTIPDHIMIGFLLQTPVINKLDKAYLDLLRQKTQLIMERRRQDTADESVDCGQFAGGLYKSRGVCEHLCSKVFERAIWGLCVSVKTAIIFGGICHVS